MEAIYIANIPKLIKTSKSIIAIFLLVEMTRLERATSSSQMTHSNQLNYISIFFTLQIYQIILE